MDIAILIWIQCFSEIEMIVKLKILRITIIYLFIHLFIL
jgi:hypothetical protein